MGYTYLGQNKIAEALALFTLNTEFYPDSCNVWDSLGEASLAAGDKELAKASYRKALESLGRDNTTSSGLKDAVRTDATAALAQLEKQP